MAEAAEKNPIEDLVQHALDQDFNKANQVFGDLMGVKINDVLDQEKIRLADQIYNGVEPEEEDEDQMELDLEDEDQEDESEDDAEEDNEESAEEEAEEDLVDGEEDEEET